MQCAIARIVCNVLNITWNWWQVINIFKYLALWRPAILLFKVARKMVAQGTVLKVSMLDVKRSIRKNRQLGLCNYSMTNIILQISQVQQISAHNYPGWVLPGLSVPLWCCREFCQGPYGWGIFVSIKQTQAVYILRLWTFTWTLWM